MPARQVDLSPRETAIDVAVGHAIRDVRRRHGMTAASDLAAAIGIPTKAGARLVSRIETADQPVTVGRLTTIAAGLGTTVVAILRAAGVIADPTPDLDLAISTDVTLAPAQRAALRVLVAEMRRQTEMQDTAPRHSRSLDEIVAGIPGITSQDRDELLVTIRQRQQAARQTRRRAAPPKS